MSAPIRFSTNFLKSSLKLCNIVAFALILLIQLPYTAANLPRGVMPAAASLYTDSGLFTCFSWDGSRAVPSPISIERDKINDDYCDCPDGSDEPGTSACSNGIFFCENKGFVPTKLVSSRVNDGICDCCDGSDEYASNANCQDDCFARGTKLREEKEKERILLEEGHKIYETYCSEGQTFKKNQEDQLTKLGNDIEELQKQWDEINRIKEEKEIPEKAAKAKHEAAWKEEKEKKNAEQVHLKGITAFHELDSDGNGLVSIEEMQKHIEFDIDRNGEVASEEAKEYLEDNETIDEVLFMEKVWPSIREIYTAAKPPEQKKGDDEDTPPIPQDEEEEEETDDENDNPESHQAPTDNENKDNPTESEDEMPEYDDETKALIEAAEQARSSFNEIDQKIKDIKKDISDIEADLKIDYGPNNEFQKVKEGGCIEYTDREYTYKLCPFDRASQRPKDGGVETTLGYWGLWNGPSDNLYSSMKYEKGQNCWNGPDRSVVVKVSCGTENQIISASEPSRCEYEFQFKSPAACGKTFSDLNKTDPEHDEL
ncbi:DgyrCDS481 [Dimorphilus gyrociliatus]|uniref:Glucosidase 2 subunit beta n=1 Tax=Dimorphilus gyrociliatus TaxID=2664684 RepID=A0A7I8V4K5_9ANNE|nr:DgyrCDS481 [Dimorphilus gyrociliatus]